MTAEPVYLRPRILPDYRTRNPRHRKSVDRYTSRELLGEVSIYYEATDTHGDPEVASWCILTGVCTSHPNSELNLVYVGET